MLALFSYQTVQATHNHNDSKKESDSMNVITKKLTAKHKSLGDLAMALEIPQAESLEEAINWAGGQGKTLTTLNWVAVFRALSGVRSAAGNPQENETAEAFAERADKIAAEAIPSAGRVGPTNKEKLSFAEAVQKRKADAQAQGEEVSGEELLAIAQEYGLA